jgi:exonuclease VII small subunit
MEARLDSLETCIEALEQDPSAASFEAAVWAYEETQETWDALQVLVRDGVGRWVDDDGAAKVDDGGASDASSPGFRVVFDQCVDADTPIEEAVVAYHEATRQLARMEHDLDSAKLQVQAD